MNNINSNRKISFGQHGVSFLDRIIRHMRSRKINKYMQGASSLLDIGCGYNAGFLKYLQKKYSIKRCMGVDLSVSRDVFDSDLTLEEGDMNFDPVARPDGFFDRVISLALIEHLNKPEHILSESFRLLSPGGELLLTTPTPAAKPILELMARLRLINPIEIEDHKNYFTKGRLKTMLLKAGFLEGNITIQRFLFGFNTFVRAVKT